MQNSRENYKKDADHARVCPPRNPRLLFISASYFTSFNSSINPRAFSPLVDHIQHIAYVNTDRALQIRFEGDITTHGLPVTIESEADQASVLVEYRTTGVTSCYIVVGKEAKLQLSILNWHIGQNFAADQVEDFRLNPEFVTFGVFLFEDPLLGRIIIIPSASYGR